MENKIAMWAFMLALAAAPAGLLLAQEGPGQEETEEVEMWEGGLGHEAPEPAMAPGGAGPARAMRGGKGARRMAWTESAEEDQGGERMTVRVRKIMGKGQGGVMGRAFMSEEDTMAVIEKNDPVFAKKVEAIKKTTPAKYRVVMQMAGKMLAGVKMQEDPALEKDAVRGLALEFESKELSRKYEKASDSEKAAIKADLKVKLSELFDLKSKGQEVRVKRMEKDLAKLKENLEKRKANKAKIVDQRLEQITGEGYSW